MTSCIAPSAGVPAPVAVAFTGTAMAIDAEAITLTVNHRYTAGESETVIVTAPTGLEALTGSVARAEGETFPVSASGGTLNYCERSEPATRELHAMGDGAFGG